MKQPPSSNGYFEPRELARLARLRYVSDSDTGYTRERNGHGFKYHNARNKPLRNIHDLARVERLAIPPAWTHVWICRFATGHLQATGRDDRKRKQYLYHERWRQVANLAKFIHIEHFGRALPKLRYAVSRDLRSRGLSRRRVLAGMVALLDATSIRVGNEEYAKANGSYGLTTLRTRHVSIVGRRAELRFRAKGGFHREVKVTEPRLVRLLKQLKGLRGGHVFQYVDDQGAIRQVSSADINDYLSELTGHPFTAKDFRTWKASALAAGLLLREPAASAIKDRNRVIKSSLAAAAEHLANTATVCRKYYVHAALLESYECGNFSGYFKGYKPGRKLGRTRDEQALLHFLRHWKPARV
jgi:DNA topoisomerase I